MKADLLNQIEVAQRRRRRQIIAVTVAILIIAAVAIAAFSTNYSSLAVKYFCRNIDGTGHGELHQISVDI